MTKTTVRHIEIEEIERVTTIDRHIHHIVRPDFSHCVTIFMLMVHFQQYHFQNVIKPEVEVRDSHSYYELVDPRLNSEHLACSVAYRRTNHRPQSHNPSLYSMHQ